MYDLLVYKVTNGDTDIHSEALELKVCLVKASVESHCEEEEEGHEHNPVTCTVLPLEVQNHVTNTQRLTHPVNIEKTQF